VQEQFHKIDHNLLVKSDSHKSLATAPLLVKYFELYCDFFVFDIESSILYGKNYEITELFRVNLVNLLNYIKDDEIRISEALNNLTLIINGAKTIFNSKKNPAFSQIKFSHSNIFKLTNLRENKILFVTKETIKNTLSDFKEFFISYDYLNSYYNVEEEVLFKDLLIELNNALSHILTAIINCYESSQSIKEVENNLDNENIKRAKSHLHRGALDGYKEIIRLNRDSVIKDKKLFDSYIIIREMESLKIGKDETKKNNIVEQYKALSIDIINNKFQSQKP
jgi:hypothetical protein